MTASVLASILALALAAQSEEDEPAARPPVPIVYGGAGYQAAFDRAQRYERDNTVNDWRNREFGPAVNGQITAIFQTCVGPRTARPGAPFVVVLSFAPDGAADGAFVDVRTPQSQCMAARLVDLRAPRPPVRDFAEEIRVEP